MLLHARAQWPQIINKSFRPFTTWHAVNIYTNCYCSQHGMAIPPSEEFTNLPASLRLNDLQPWGLYVLDKCLQDSNHLSSKWDPHAWLGIYVGHSMIHSGNVVLVYNPITGHTTPQFHVVFDDQFQTVTPCFSSLPSETITNLFETLWTTSQWIYNDDIPPEYLFPEMHDLPDAVDVNGNENTDPNSQLATDSLDVFDYYINGTSPPEIPTWRNSISSMVPQHINPDQRNNSGFLNPSPDQSTTSGITDPHPNQRNTSGLTNPTPDQSNTTGPNSNTPDQSNTSGP